MGRDFFKAEPKNESSFFKKADLKTNNGEQFSKRRISVLIYKSSYHLRRKRPSYKRKYGKEKNAINGRYKHDP